MDAFPHPETGELLESPADFRAALDRIAWRMSPLFRLRSQIQEAFAERYEAELPVRRHRTTKQEQVARCPRCGGKQEAA